MPEYKEYTIRVFANGCKGWYLNGKLHREDGPAFERPTGYKAWYLNGQRHREDGPAVEYPDGHKVWCLNGEIHREDGPAVIKTNGNKAWYLNGEWICEEEFWHLTNSEKKNELEAIELIEDTVEFLEQFGYSNGMHFEQCKKLKEFLARQ